jgi:hypothetical protein
MLVISSGSRYNLSKNPCSITEGRLVVSELTKLTIKIVSRYVSSPCSSGECKFLVRGEISLKLLALFAANNSAPNLPLFIAARLCLLLN